MLRIQGAWRLFRAGQGRHSPWVKLVPDHTHMKKEWVESTGYAMDYNTCQSILKSSYPNPFKSIFRNTQKFSCFYNNFQVVSTKLQFECWVCWNKSSQNNLIGVGLIITQIYFCKFIANALRGFRIWTLPRTAQIRSLLSSIQGPSDHKWILHQVKIILLYYSDIRDAVINSKGVMRNSVGS